MRRLIFTYKWCVGKWPYVLAILPFPFFKIKWTLYMACWNLLLLSMISLICFRQRIAKLILDLWRETGQTYLQCLPCQRLVCQNRRDCRPEPGVCCSLWTMSLAFKYDNWYPSLSPVWKYDECLVDYTVLYIQATFHGWPICGGLDHTTILIKESNFLSLPHTFLFFLQHRYLQSKSR